jgi:hypothetical protein
MYEEKLKFSISINKSKIKMNLSLTTKIISVEKFNI